MNLTQSAFLLSAAAQEILTVIYRQQKITDSVQINFIAAKAGFSFSVVTESVKKLEEIGLLHYEKYGQITLTTEGKRYAKQLMEHVSGQVSVHAV